MLLSKRQDIDYKYFEYKLRNDYPTYEGMKMEGNNIYLSFSDDETAYSSAINTFHDGLINTDTIDKKYAKIYRYMTDDPPHCKLEAPIDHNYITDLTIRLHPKRTMVKGEVQKVEWFSDEATTDLILKVDINYTRDPLGFALDRTTIRTWINEDETIHTVTSGTPEDGTSGVFDSGIMDAGSTFEYTFDSSGRYDYYCSLHPWMLGVLEVQSAEISIPDWVRNNAKWWADGQISDKDFASGLEYLIENGIIHV